MTKPTTDLHKPEIIAPEWLHPVVDLSAVMADPCSYEKTSINMLLERINGYGLGGWHVGPSKDGIQVHHGDIKNCEWPAMRTTGVVHASPERVVAILTDIGAAPQLDKFTKSAKIVEQLSPTMELRYFETIGVLFVAPRDFCSTTTVQTLHDGRLVIASRSVTTDKCPTKSGYVRAQALLSGYIVSRRDDGHSDVTMFANVDFGGYMPGPVIKMVGLSAPIKIFQTLRTLAAAS
ncbi:hypothetical protein SDRG_06951 [Saprolegnia diclina VS20]|uniref:START domain-containing protein n=1 Tax=Saprolegnia diclina (strain VS20) TaxID=1156394 RepID=T0QCP3_SAPDV|nr:hypothetical protein SDRG_06951 [Saprolegnia diclina VS20]EQC35669.1 hypothetical protein SDRG_06951 [Saprolegnia diclina VS20]|eukprot:XP_008610986.1 hypothetical protein SDRG_06951 [Saprolegnia diclina VS20]